MNKANRQEILNRFAIQNPHPKTELVYRTPFELLIGVMLSAQATDVSVNLATAKLFAVANTPQDILALGAAALMEHIKSIGLYRAKTANILKTCEQLLTHHHGEVPENRAALEALPGVGRKTANVILATVFDQPAMAVDTHVFRVANRTGFAPGKTVRQVEDGLMKHIPQALVPKAHHWFILHGRYTCKARKPNCAGCPIIDVCDYPQKTIEVT